VNWDTQIERIYAPFAPGQVVALNQFQKSGSHPFTCDNGLCIDEDGSTAALIARERGWICPHCAYTQNWAHKFMAEGQEDERG